MSCKFLLQESYVFMGTLPIQYTTKYLVHCLEYNNEPIRGPVTVVDTVVGFNENFLVNDEELFSAAEPAYCFINYLLFISQWVIIYCIGVTWHYERVVSSSEI